MSGPLAPPSHATVHLVRHGEVENPRGVVYGRMPGYNLSERGTRQAASAARRLEDADIASIWASPLERAQETAHAIAQPHGLEVVTDERLIESDTTFEGATRSILSFLRSPRQWWSFRNPMRPSWGETFVEIRERMLGAIEDALEQAGGREAVIVSHQTPVIVARLALARSRLPPWLPLTLCDTGSVTTLVLDKGRLVTASYFKPPDR
ncbi:MAG: histidine phosphatase family protein [Actinomycetota bacterium]